MSEAKFNDIYAYFDIDGDGQISYKDFHHAIGSEIHPAEGLYFRQDKLHHIKHDKCLQDQCWQQCVGNGKFCSLHLQIYSEKVKQVFIKLFEQVGKSKWKDFVLAVRESENNGEISILKLEAILHSLLGLKLSGNKKKLLSNTSGIQRGAEQFIDASLILNTERCMRRQQMLCQLTSADVSKDA